MYHKNGRCESSCLRESLEAKYLLKTRKNVFLDTLDVPVDKSEHFMSARTKSLKCLPKLQIVAKSFCLVTFSIKVFF